jgi:Mrp family chromosome partitioning ATPase
VVFVIRASRTRRQDVKRALGALDQVHARMLGAVLNMVAPTRQSRRGYGYSSYYTSSSEGDVVAPEEFPVVAASDAALPTPPRPRPSPRPRPRPEPALDRREEKAVPVTLLRVGAAGEGRPDARNDC